MADAPLERDLETRVEELGYELVVLERLGSRSRPIFRAYIDRVGPEGETGVTHGDCRLVSRALEEYLDERDDVSERYVLEVSSPGVERPLTRPRDFERFAGKEIAVQARTPLEGRGKRLEGELLGLRGQEAEARVALRLADGEEVEIPRSDITKAHLVFRWEEHSRDRKG